MERFKIVKDPVHGYIRILPHELEILDTFAFQRLRRIKQLAVVDLVYPGAVHTRFSHSLGVAHVVEKFLEELLPKAEVPQSERERYLVFMRLVALLHDIGHGPYSHVFEDFVLYPRGTSHEIVGALIIEKCAELADPIERILSEYGFRLKDIQDALKSASEEEWPLRSSLGSSSERILFHLMKGAFSADIIDYLLRDSYYTGAGYGSGVDWIRLAHCLCVHGDKIVLDKRGLEVLDQVLIARLWMFSTVYYHKTVRAASYFVGRMLTEIDRKGVLSYDEYINEPTKYVTLDDYTILTIAMSGGVEEARDLLKRRIPYRAVAEHRIAMPDLARPLEVLLSMSKDYLETIIEEDLRRRGLEYERGRDFFIDTPKLPLNPMLGGEHIYVLDPSTGEVQRRSVLELSWFHIPKTVAVIRLYIDRDRVDDPTPFIDSFRKVMNPEELRSFY